MRIYDLETCKTYLKAKYGVQYSDEDLSILYDRAVSMFLYYRFPFNNEITEIPEEEMQRNSIWLLDYMMWYIEWAGISNMVGYSENGVSWKFDKAGTPQELIDRLISYAN